MIIPNNKKKIIIKRKEKIKPAQRLRRNSYKLHVCVFVDESAHQRDVFFVLCYEYCLEDIISGLQNVLLPLIMGSLGVY